jgi:hypothetical protein
MQAESARTYEPLFLRRHKAIFPADSDDEMSFPSTMRSRISFGVCGHTTQTLTLTLRTLRWHFFVFLFTLVGLA